MGRCAHPQYLVSFFKVIYIIVISNFDKASLARRGLGNPRCHIETKTWAQVWDGFWVVTVTKRREPEPCLCQCKAVKYCISSAAINIVFYAFTLISGE